MYIIYNQTQNAKQSYRVLVTPSTRVDGCHTSGSWSRVLVRKGVGSNLTVDRSIFCFEIEIS